MCVCARARVTRMMPGNPRLCRNMCSLCHGASESAREQVSERASERESERARDREKEKREIESMCGCVYVCVCVYTRKRETKSWLTEAALRILALGIAPHLWCWRIDSSSITARNGNRTEYYAYYAYGIRLLHLRHRLRLLRLLGLQALLLDDNNSLPDTDTPQDPSRPHHPRAFWKTVCPTNLMPCLCIPLHSGIILFTFW